MKLIDKDALVAEIDKRIDENKLDLQRATRKHLEDYFEGYEDALAILKKQYLDSVEVKEVDLEKEMDKYFDEHDEEFCRGEYLDFAKHFFELGLKTQKGEEVDLDKEIDLVEDKYHGFESLSRSDVIEIIKYFFELGLKENRYKTQLSDEI